MMYKYLPSYAHTLSCNALGLFSLQKSYVSQIHEMKTSHEAEVTEIKSAEWTSLVEDQLDIIYAHNT